MSDPIFELSSYVIRRRPASDCRLRLTYVAMLSFDRVVEPGPDFVVYGSGEKCDAKNDFNAFLRIFDDKSQTKPRFKRKKER